MGRAGARFHEWRRVEMGDAKRLQIGGDARGGIEIEILGELNTVGRDGNRRSHYLSPIRHTTDHGVPTPVVVLPQIVVPVLGGAALTALSERLAVRCSLSPSPIFQKA